MGSAYRATFLTLQTLNQLAATTEVPHIISPSHALSTEYTVSNASHGSRSASRHNTRNSMAISQTSTDDGPSSPTLTGFRSTSRSTSHSDEAHIRPDEELAILRHSFESERHRTLELEAEIDRLNEVVALQSHELRHLTAVERQLRQQLSVEHDSNNKTSRHVSKTGKENFPRSCSTARSLNLPSATKNGKAQRDKITNRNGSSSRLMSFSQLRNSSNAAQDAASVSISASPQHPNEYALYREAVEGTMLRLQAEVLSLRKREEQHRKADALRNRQTSTDHKEMTVLNSELQTATRRIEELEASRSQLQGEFFEELCRLRSKCDAAEHRVGDLLEELESAEVRVCALLDERSQRLNITMCASFSQTEVVVETMRQDRIIQTSETMRGMHLMEERLNSVLTEAIAREEDLNHQLKEAWHNEKEKTDHIDELTKALREYESITRSSVGVEARVILHDRAVGPDEDEVDIETVLPTNRNLTSKTTPSVAERLVDWSNVLGSSNRSVLEGNAPLSGFTKRTSILAPSQAASPIHPGKSFRLSNQAPGRPVATLMGINRERVASRSPSMHVAGEFTGTVTGTGPSPSVSSHLRDFVSFSHTQNTPDALHNKPESDDEDESQSRRALHLLANGHDPSRIHQHMNASSDASRGTGMRKSM